MPNCLSCPHPPETHLLVSGRHSRRGDLRDPRDVAKAAVDYGDAVVRERAARPVGVRG